MSNVHSLNILHVLLFFLIQSDKIKDGLQSSQLMTPTRHVFFFSLSDHQQLIEHKLKNQTLNWLLPNALYILNQTVYTFLSISLRVFCYVLHAKVYTHVLTMSFLLFLWIKRQIYNVNDVMYYTQLVNDIVRIKSQVCIILDSFSKLV